MHRIIANKKIDVTDDEWRLYQKICNGYPQGKKVFIDLFETDDDGFIIMLKPPEKEFTMEAVIYLQNLMVHQHLRKIYKEHDEALNDINSMKKELEDQIKELKSLKGSREVAKENI